MNRESAPKLPSASGTWKSALGVAAVSAIESFHGGKALLGLVKIRQDQLDQIKRVVQYNNEQRLEKFFEEMLNADSTMTEDQANALIGNSDFHALLKACVGDIEDEKVRAYARLAFQIATGAVAVRNRRHFILSLRDLSIHELHLLRNAFMARELQPVPFTGASPLLGEDVLYAAQAGSLHAIRVANLQSRGFVINTKITELGSQLSRSIFGAQDLTLDTLGFSAMASYKVLIIGGGGSDGLEPECSSRLTQALRRLGCDSTTAGSQRLSDPEYTHAVLMVDGASASYSREFAEQLLPRVKAVGLLLSPYSKAPAGLDIPFVEYNPEQAEVGIEEAVERLFGLQQAG